jgi:nucleoside phosphorylase
METSLIINGPINRHSDTNLQSTPPVVNLNLPSIDWAKIQMAAPKMLPIGKRNASDPLPIVDVVIITWTSAEWFALDHVFVNNSKSGNPSDYSFRKNWHLYTKNTTNFSGEAKTGDLWGMFNLVEIVDQINRPWRVLLFKSNAHLAHAPWIEGLSAMMKNIIEDTNPKQIYSIGTAGGGRLDQTLGDAVISNSAILKLERPQNIHDYGNGQSYRCPNWYPCTRILDKVEKNLLFKMSSVANNNAFLQLFENLKNLHKDDDALKNIELNDLINKPLSDDALNNPKIERLIDSPLLTTDFYYVATNNNSEAYSFLEMDDAVIIREANKYAVPVACIRNISDPIVPLATKSGAIIPENVRNDWSGLIYSTFGIFSSFNGALATWATIAGQGEEEYNPIRSTDLSLEDDPLEVKLAYQVRSCGTCNFFWPKDKDQQTYGPYTAFDFNVSQPYPAEAIENSVESPWVFGITRPPAFPNGEIIDGCRKAPIMTLGINPNLTAFAPGLNGAAWVYPNFTSDNYTDAWTKYAWYYRYRSVYQEKLSFEFIKKYILNEGLIIATKNGVIVEAIRPNENQNWNINIRYEGEENDTEINLPGKVGDFPYVLLFDTQAPNNAFKAGDVIAGKIAVPEGIQIEIMQEEQGYYMRFVPVLNYFTNFLKSKGIANPNLKIGEDVSQIDMVACASPHWTEGFLGNDMKTVVNNCVSKNAWAIKQIVMSKPDVLFIVSESSWNMFYGVLGNYVDKNRISEHPADNAYTLLRETSDNSKPVYLNLSCEINGVKYEHKIRIVITPHFSFANNFIPQFRLEPSAFNTISQQKDFIEAITPQNGFTIIDADIDHPSYYREIQLDNDNYQTSCDFLLANYRSLYDQLNPYYYNPLFEMAEVLNSMYDAGDLTYNSDKNYLGRSQDACKFCVNKHWQFKNECRYEKHLETSPTAGFLESCANEFIKNGSPWNKI